MKAYHPSAIYRLAMVALAAAGVGAAAWSCSEDRDPVYQEPTEFVLNTPVVQDQYLELTPTGTIQFECSQPNYGYSAVTQYSMEFSLTQDFAQSYAVPSVDKTSAVITVRQADLATGLCVLNGFTSEDNYRDLPAGVVYCRAVAQLDGVESSRIASNVVALNRVKGYFAVAVPGYIYLVGSPEGWAGPTEGNAEHYAPWRLYEPKDGIGSEVYTGVFEIPAAPLFRFYTALTGWDADSWGTQMDDSPVEFPDAFADGSFSSELVKGKGSFSFPNWPGGTMTITVDMGARTITIYEGAVDVGTTKYIYLVGSPEGWAGPTEDNADHYKPWRLACSTGDDVYTGTFDMPAAPVFRFYTALTGWDDDSWGYQPDDSATDLSLTDGLYQGAIVAGKGSYSFPDFAGGKMSLTVDMAGHTVAFSAL